MHKIDDQRPRARARPDLRPPARRLRPAHRAHGAVRGRRGRQRSSSEDRSGWPVEERLKHRIIDGDRDGLKADLEEQLTSRPGAVDRQRRAPRRHEGRRRALRPGRDAAPVRAPERRDDEGRGRLPRAAHGEGRRRRQGPRRASARSRATSTTSARTSSTSSSPTTATRCTTSASRRRCRAFVEKATEVAADAIGMSGLLVKSTLIMRENLQELNAQGLAEIPVLLGGAALTRTYVERDLREVYEGRLFYGKDAFEGLHTMDRSWRASAAACWIPTSGARSAAAILPPRKSEMEAERRGHRRYGLDPTSPPTSRSSRPPFLGSRVAKGVAARRHRRVHQRDRAVPQPVAVPTRQDAGRDRHGLQGAHPPDAAGRARRGQGGGLAGARGDLGLLPGQRRRQRPRRVDRRRAAERAPAVRVPASAQRSPPLHRRLLPAGRERRGRLRRLPRGDHGRARHRARARAVRRRPLPGVPAHPRAVGRDDRSARRAVAPPHPGGVGLRRRGRPDAGRAVPPAVPRARGTRGATRPAPTSKTRPSSTSSSSCTGSA